MLVPTYSWNEHAEDDRLIPVAECAWTIVCVAFLPEDPETWILERAWGVVGQEHPEQELVDGLITFRLSPLVDAELDGLVGPLRDKTVFGAGYAGMRS